MNDSIYKSIKALPPLDDTVIKIQEICRNENSTIGDLVDVIKKDPMLTANILRSANSPLYGFSREIRDVAQAVNLFGMATIRGFALYGSTKQNFKIDLSPYGINAGQFMDIVGAQNAIAFEWCKNLDRSLLNVISPASFLMEIGKLILSKEIIEINKTNEFLSKVKTIKTTKELSELEIFMLGIDSEEVTAKILEHWNLEYEIIESISHINNPEKAPKPMQKFCLILNAVTNTINVLAKFDTQGVQRAKQIAQSYNLSADKLQDAINKVKG